MTTQELVELLHEAIESGMSVCYDDTFAAAASRLSEMEEEIKRLRDEIEQRERDAANDRAFNKGGPEAEYGKQSILEIIALSDDMIEQS